MATKKRVGRKRLSVDIPEAWHAELFRIAISRNITITKLIIRLIYKEIQDQKQYE